MARIDGRAFNELRKLDMVPGFLSHPAGSVLISCGGTRVICAASLENSVPPWMKAQKVPGGWITCEYGMLPASTHDRMKREASSGKQGGRTVEIQRLALLVNGLVGGLHHIQLQDLLLKGIGNPQYVILYFNDSALKAGSEVVYIAFGIGDIICEAITLIPKNPKESLT